MGILAGFSIRTPAVKVTEVSEVELLTVKAGGRCCRPTVGDLYYPLRAQLPAP